MENPRWKSIMRGINLARSFRFGTENIVEFDRLIRAYPAFNLKHYFFYFPLDRSSSKAKIIIDAK